MISFSSIYCRKTWASVQCDMNTWSDATPVYHMIWCHSPRPHDPAYFLCALADTTPAYKQDQAFIFRSRNYANDLLSRPAFIWTLYLFEDLWYMEVVCWWVCKCMFVAYKNQAVDSSILLSSSSLRWPCVLLSTYSPNQVVYITVLCMALDFVGE